MSITERAVEALQTIAYRRAMIATATSAPWVCDGYDVKQRGGRMIAYVGPHHTPASEYPASCKLTDERNGDFVAASRNERDGELAALATVVQDCMDDMQGADEDGDTDSVRALGRRLTTICDQLGVRP